MGPSRYKFSKQLREARLRRGVTQDDIAEYADITSRWYQMLEGGYRLPSFSVGIQLMAYLDIPVESFFPEAIQYREEIRNHPHDPNSRPRSKYR